MEKLKMNKYIDKSRYDLLDIINARDSWPITPAKSIDLLTDIELKTYIFYLEEIDAKGLEQVEIERGI
jgi:hypothetical protein